MNVSTFRTYIFQENEETHVKCMQVTFQIDKKQYMNLPFDLTLELCLFWISSIVQLEA